MFLLERMVNIVSLINSVGEKKGELDMLFNVNSHVEENRHTNTQFFTPNKLTLTKTAELEASKIHNREEKNKENASDTDKNGNEYSVNREDKDITKKGEEFLTDSELVNHTNIDTSHQPKNDPNIIQEELNSISQPKLDPLELANNQSPKSSKITFNQKLESIFSQVSPKSSPNHQSYYSQFSKSQYQSGATMQQSNSKNMASNNMASNNMASNNFIPVQTFPYNIPPNTYPQNNSLNQVLYLQNPNYSIHPNVKQMHMASKKKFTVVPNNAVNRYVEQIMTNSSPIVGMSPLASPTYRRNIVYTSSPKSRNTQPRK